MWPEAPRTEEMLDECRRGESEAVERLLGAYREPLRRMIGLRLDPALAARLDASDVVQDVLVEVHRRLSDYLRNPVMPFPLWLRHIAQDHLIDAHRRHRVARRRSMDREQPLAGRLGDESSFELAGQLLDHERTPASEAVSRELQRRLETAVAALPDADREVILLRHGEQLSNQETAAALGTTEAAASMRYLRAVRKLRAALLPGGGSNG